MGLRLYRKKRDFSKTPEPSGRSTPAARSSFTVQRHHASRLHYDFRLELDGVLKSWAVPKGPCLDPDEKRLAVEVEDHPVEYGGFEGQIPKGEYGAGTVVLWDRGQWQAVEDPHRGLEKGHLRFELRGRKLRGRWDLVRMRGKEENGKTNWLLIKENDEESRSIAEYDITQARPESVAAIEDRRKKKIWHSVRKEKEKKTRAIARPVSRRPRRMRSDRLRHIPGARRAGFPVGVHPELATLVDQSPSGDEWIHEIKYDGYRILARLEKGCVTLLSRRGNDWTDHLSPLASALAELPVKQALIDGEAVVLDERGVSSFQALQNLLSQKGRGRLVYYAFDLLYLDGWDLRDAPLERRKEALSALLAGAPQDVRFSDHIEGNGPEFFAQACANSLEGIVSKRKDARYASARTRQWLKVKCLMRQEFVVCGYTDPTGSRPAFGALLLGLRGADGALAYVGRVGTGFDGRTLSRLLSKLKPLAIQAPAMRNPPTGAAARGAHWVEPTLVAEVGFSGWTDEGIVRQARYLGLRADKPAGAVRQEIPQALTARARLTHPDKVLYPEQGVTKLDLARYYETVAAWALPHIARRPLAIVRCPSGRQHHCFFQKHLGELRPEGLLSVDIAESGVTRPYLYIEDVTGLVSLAQLGALEIHPWGSRVDRLEQPDLMTFDLDPAPGVPWARVIKAALETHERLKQLELESFVKTTGGKGLHVVVPLAPRANWGNVKAFSKALVEVMVRDAPRLYTGSLSKASRSGKIFIDYLRNGRGATAVAPYSTRARPHATVAAPLSWQELSPKLASDRFTLRTMPARLNSLPHDPWAGFFDVRQSLR